MIAFRADGNKDIGMGHLMRCICIAENLVQSGNEVIFIVSPDSDTQIIAQHNLRVIQMKSAGPLGWNLQELTETIGRYHVNVLIVDSYRTTRSDFAELRTHTKVIYLDDLYTFDAKVDVVINCNIDSKAEPYERSNIMDRKVYTGVDYFPLRKEFDGYKNGSIRREVSTVLITTGSTDPFHCTAQIVEALPVTRYPNVMFVILLGKYYPGAYVDKLKLYCTRYKNVIFAPWGGNIAKLISESDILISSGSSTVLEALSLGVPCITFQFAENHKTECEELDRREMAPWAGIYDSNQSKDTNRKLRELFKVELDYEIRKRQYDAFSRCFDGNGLQRIVDIINQTNAPKQIRVCKWQ